MKDKKEKIMQSAIRLFCKNGFQATSTTSITKDAGVGTGTLFVHFANKDDLINSVYLQCKTGLKLALSHCIDLENSFKQNLWSVWEGFIEWALHNKESYAFLNQFRNSPYIDTIVQDKVQEEFQFIEVWLQEQWSGNDGEGTNEILFVKLMILNALNSVIEVIKQNKLHQKKQIMEQAFSILFHGIASGI